MFEDLTRIGEYAKVGSWTCIRVVEEPVANPELVYPITIADSYTDPRESLLPAGCPRITEATTIPYLGPVAAPGTGGEP